MASLHTLNSADVAQWHSCRETLTPGDLVLLIEEGCYRFQTVQAELPAQVQLFCLHNDLQSRGLTYPTAQKIDYAQWVKLACSAQRNFSW